MQHFSVTACLCATLLAATTASSAPFGVDLATATPDTLGCRATKRPTLYLCDKMPDETWSMGDYSLLYKADRGVCSISADGGWVKTNSDGTAVREALDTFKDRLTQIYGEPKLRDGSYNGQPLPEDQSWMSQVLEIEREYSYVWSFDPPREGMAEMSLSAFASDIDQGGYVLQIYAPGAQECFIPK